MQDDLYKLYVQVLQEFRTNEVSARELFYRLRGTILRSITFYKHLQLSAAKWSI